ncbi:MAG: DUF6320 domain-containing protein [Oscillospiraceae bacterium]|nr:DUF6320 domain-containing protein [Oscillospiraceae bacterium]
MKRCNECKVNIVDNTELCPLCNAPLEEVEGQPCTSVYPVQLQSTRYNFVKRLLVYLSVLGAGACAIVNYFQWQGKAWSLIPITALAFLWLVGPQAVRRGGNVAAKVMRIIFATCAYLVILDCLLGYRGWAIDYGIAIALCAGVLAIDIIMIVRRESFEKYVWYQGILVLCGLIPLVLFFTGVAASRLFAFITAGVALASLLATFVFGDRNAKNEFKRRFHV